MAVRRTRLRIAAVGLSTGLLAACPGPINQVEHTAELESAPDVSCVWQRLLELSRVPKVDTSRSELPMGVGHNFFIDTGKNWQSIGIVILNDGGAMYHNTAGARDMDEAGLRVAKQSALYIDAALSGHCGLSELSAAVETACYSKHCDAVMAD